MRLTTFGTLFTLITFLALVLGGCEPNRLAIETVPDGTGATESGGNGQSGGVGANAGAGPSGGVDATGGGGPGGTTNTGGGAGEVSGGATASGGVGGTGGSGTGGIVGCPTGFIGADCDQCEIGYYGATCQLCACGNGTCSDTREGDGTCTCATGWEGSSCDICAANHYGATCQPCTCSADQTCNDGLAGDGACYDCEAGFVGVLCDACQANRYGPDCTPCACASGTCAEGILGDGSCACTAGWDGELCDRCADGYFGSVCTTCACERGICADGSAGDGSCACTAGWDGELCDTCAAGYFGEICTACNCGNGPCADGAAGDGSCACDTGWDGTTCTECAAGYYGATCTACDCVTGTCSDGLAGDGACYDCDEGFLGDACDVCQANRYGPNCVVCGCQNGTCDEGIAGTGACTCPDGFTGDLCEACEVGFYGPNCLPCQCANGTCSDGITGDGSCACATGWDGTLCDDCDPNYYGANCTACSCVHGDCADGVTGTGACACDTGWTGTSCTQCVADYWGASCTACQCDQGSCGDGLTGSGACACDTGWTGPTCAACNANYWGSNCQACSCGGGSCNDGLSGDGSCYACPTGFTGASCNECQTNRYGPTCALCTCVHGVCNEGRIGDGTCACATGWTGPNCDTCAPGYYGTQCLECPDTPTVGCPCDGSPVLACAGAAQKVQLTCPAGGGNWQQGGICGGGLNCDQPTGTCATIVTECVGHASGYAYCGPTTSGGYAEELRSCGVDLVTYSSTICGGICSVGACRPPECGNLKLENTEECDDGELVAADGCEENCQLSRVVKVAAGANHSCALFASGDVRCWGANNYNQLGLGHANSVATSHPYQLSVVDLGGPAQDVVAGSDHNCALLTDQTIRCWGRNDYAQLGFGDQIPRLTQTPNSLGAISVGGAATKIAAGGAVSCALLSSGVVRCWGLNSSGRLGLGIPDNVSYTQVPSVSPTIALGGTATDIAFGTTFGCAILTGGTARCWGYNYYGQLGRGHMNTIGDDETPAATDPNSASNGLVEVPVGETPASLQLGSDHACLLFTSGNIQCWGRGAYGRLGYGATADIGDNESAADTVDLGAAATDFATGNDFTCAILAATAMKCWGRNSLGELGYGDRTARGGTSSTQPASLPVVAFGGRTPVQVFAAGAAQHVCVLLDNGEVRCWGLNTSGQLGLGFVSTTPTYVGGVATQTPALLASLAIFRAP